MKLTISNRQRKFLNNGWAAYIKRLMIIGIIGGFIFGVIIAISLYSNHMQFSPEKPVFGKITLGFLIPIAGFAFLALLVGNRGWLHLKFAVWQVVVQDLIFDVTTAEEVEHLFGKPSKTETKNDAVYYYYFNTRHKIYDIKLEDVKFKFINDRLKEYVKLS